MFLPTWIRRKSALKLIPLTRGVIYIYGSRGEAKPGRARLGDVTTLGKARHGKARRARLGEARRISIPLQCNVNW